jgi:DGQHR domain-containing protein
MKRLLKRSARKSFIRRPALRIEQNKKHSIYLFSLTGDDILRIAEISRLSRDDAGKLIGYQRADVKRHIEDIVEYLNSDDILFPNSLILALTSKVRFRAQRSSGTDRGSIETGILEIPLSRNGNKPGWIVDGQQRALAISKSKRRDLSIPVNAFVADDVALQRDQFLRVNNTRPLPRGLITELLPEVSAPLPTNLQQKKIPSAVCELLNAEPQSPFYRLISRASTPQQSKGMP